MNEANQSEFDGVSAVVRDPLHFKYKLDIGEDETRRGTYQLKNMLSGEQQEGTLEELLSILQGSG